MSGQPTKLVKQWYDDFKKRNLTGVVGIFSDDAVVTYGSGGSNVAVDYSGVYKGKHDIEQYFAARFSQAPRLRDIRPYCGVIGPDCIEFGCWVVVAGQIKDRKRDGTPTYDGNFLAIWNFDPDTGLVVTLDVYFETKATLNIVGLNDWA